MIDKSFIDTNLWIYLYSGGAKGAKVKELLIKNFESVTISTQILGELFNTLVKKEFRKKEESKAIILDLVSNFEVVPVSTAVVLKAIKINIIYKYSYWDSLIIAAALESKCSILYSEDMQYNQIIEKRLKIVNPFI